MGLDLPNSRMYFSKFLTVFLQGAKFICQNWKYIYQHLSPASPQTSRACLDVNILRFQIEKGVRAVQLTLPRQMRPGGVPSQLWFWIFQIAKYNCTNCKVYRSKWTEMKLSILILHPSQVSTHRARKTLGKGSENNNCIFYGLLPYPPRTPPSAPPLVPLVWSLNRYKSLPPFFLSEIRWVRWIKQYGFFTTLDDPRRP